MVKLQTSSSFFLMEGNTEVKSGRIEKLERNKRKEILPPKIFQRGQKIDYTLNRKHAENTL